MTKKFQNDAIVISNKQLKGDYYRICLSEPQIAAAALPGQFIHLQVPNLPHRVLRRPFSISDCDCEQGELSIVYKVVGEGTTQLQKLSAGEKVNILGPLGKGFSALDNEPALLLGGGYGCAAIYYLAKKAKQPPTILLGARNKQDIIMQEDFEALGCKVLISTDDGSLGKKGLITVLLKQELEKSAKLRVSACGPVPMLKAVGLLCEEYAIDAELSLDSLMCCGMGACFACVIKCKTDNEQGWHYVRTCQDGPVFKASEIFWD
jgi:dihydroorotate dehydrogenase electron transfer subunit